MRAMWSWVFLLWIVCGGAIFAVHMAAARERIEWIRSVTEMERAERVETREETNDGYPW